MTEKEFEKCIDRYSRLLWSVAAPIIEGAGSEQDVEECVADVFIDLWKDPASFDPARGSLKTWLCLKCRSKAIDRFRKLSSRMAEELTEDKVSGLAEDGEGLPDSEMAEALRHAVERLREPEREVIIRRFFMEQKPARIAKAMGLGLRKVENIIYRAKGKLRDELRGIYDEMQ